MNLVCLYKIAFKSKMEADRFFTLCTDLQISMELHYKTNIYI